jgi:hypothetical protein
MRARSLPVAALAALAFLVPGSAFAEDPVPAPGAKPEPLPRKSIVIPNARCPVTGEPTQVETTVSWGDLEIRLCCPGCSDEFKADPAKFARFLLVDLTEQLDAAGRRIKVLEAKCEEMQREQEERAEKAPKPTPDKQDPPK